MPSNVKIALAIFAYMMSMFSYVYHQKKQFYPTVVYLSKSGAAISACYVEALILGLIVSQILRKIFFGELRPVESERLAERSWYALTETCLAFTIFKDENVPSFVFLFAFLIFMKNFHFLVEERVDLIERSMFLSKIFHVRIASAFFFLSAIDTSLILYALKSTLQRGPSTQVAFGFEYCILFIMLLDSFIKYATHLYGMVENVSPEDRAVAQMYVAVFMNSLKMLLYCMFFLFMIQMFTFPLFVLRPMYFTLKAFKKSVMNVLMTRRALRYLNNFYPDVTENDLNTHDNSCIICREELTMASKKLPCSHIFHTACLRAWFQRQQSCPTCRFSILKVPQNVQMARMRASTTVQAETQTELSQTGSTHTCICNLLTSTSSDPIPTSLDDLTEEELVNLENSRKEELRQRIQKLTELSRMMEVASRVIQQLPDSSRPSDASRQRPSGETCFGSHVNLQMVREKRMRSLTKAPQADDESDP